MKIIISTINLAALTCLIFLSLPGNAVAQVFNDVSIGAGLSESWILGVQKAKKPFVPLKRDGPIEGGSFDNSQSGLDVRAIFTVDEEKRWRIPLGLDYSFYSAKERVPEGYSIKQYFSHNVNIAQFYTGAHYVLYKLKYARARAWIGAEIRASYVHNAHYTFRIDYLNYDIMDDTITGTKPSAFRVGPTFRLGFDGELGEGISVNLSGQYTYLNLFGKEAARGELLTPGSPKKQEQVESPLHIFGISLMLQTRI